MRLLEVTEPDGTLVDAVTYLAANADDSINFFRRATFLCDGTGCRLSAFQTLTNLCRQKLGRRTARKLSSKSYRQSHHRQCSQDCYVSVSRAQLSHDQVAPLVGQNLHECSIPILA